MGLFRRGAGVSAGAAVKRNSKKYKTARKKDDDGTDAS
jgi:hypothetical protein